MKGGKGMERTKTGKEREGSGPQWRKSGLKSGGTNLWRALEILKYDKNLGGQLVLASPTANSGGFVPRDLRPCRTPNRKYRLRL
jgi:hypothetical protein